MKCIGCRILFSVRLQLLRSGGILAICGLCACSLSSESTQAEKLPTRFEEMEIAAVRLTEAFTPLQYTLLPDLPTSGRVEYNGFMQVQLANRGDEITDGMIGELSVQVSFFASGDMAIGTVRGVVDAEGTAMDGELSISGGELDRAGDPQYDATFIFNADGTLIDDNGHQLVFQTVFEGDFVGADASGLAGGVVGQVHVDGNSQHVGGQFIATN